MFRCLMFLVISKSPLSNSFNSGTCVHTFTVLKPKFSFLLPNLCGFRTALTFHLTFVANCETLLAVCNLNSFKFSEMGMFLSLIWKLICSMFTLDRSNSGVSVVTCVHKECVNESDLMAERSIWLESKYSRRFKKNQQIVDLMFYYPEFHTRDGLALIRQNKR